MRAPWGPPTSPPRAAPATGPSAPIALEIPRPIPPRRLRGTAVCVDDAARLYLVEASDALARRGAADLRRLDMLIYVQLCSTNMLCLDRYSMGIDGCFTTKKPSHCREPKGGSLSRRADEVPRSGGATQRGAARRAPAPPRAEAQGGSSEMRTRRRFPNRGGCFLPDNICCTQPAPPDNQLFIIGKSAPA